MVRFEGESSCAASFALLTIVVAVVVADAADADEVIAVAEIAAAVVVAPGEAVQLTKPLALGEGV